MRRHGPTWMAGTTLLLAACASSPEHFYTLQPRDSRAPDPPSRADYAVVVTTVTVPSDVDRPELVVRDRAQGVLVLEEERWIEPLPSAVRRALAQDLGERLRDAVVLEDGETAVHPKVIRVAVYVRRFDIAPATSVRLEADWLLIEGNAPARQGSAEAVVPVHARGYAVLVAAASQAIAQLSDAIAASLDAARADSAAGSAR
jgi:uncharacterized protein